MLNEVSGLLQKLMGGQVDQQSVSQAATDHVSSMDHSELTDHLQTAAANADQNGQGDIAQQIMVMVQQNGTDPQALKQEAISMISSNPQILQQFAPDFAKNLLSRL